MRVWNVAWPWEVNLLYFLPGQLRMNTFPCVSPTPPLCGLQLKYTGVPSWMADNLEWVRFSSLGLEFTCAPHATLGFAQNAWIETKFPTVPTENVRRVQVFYTPRTSNRHHLLNLEVCGGSLILAHRLIAPDNEPLIRSQLRPGVLQTGIFSPV